MGGKMDTNENSPRETKAKFLKIFRVWTKYLLRKCKKFLFVCSLKQKLYMVLTYSNALLLNVYFLWILFSFSFFANKFAYFLGLLFFLF